MNSGFLRRYAQVPFHAFPNKTKHFSFLQNSRLTLRPAHPPIQRVPVSLSQGVLQPGRVADRSLAPSGKARNEQDLVPLPTDLTFQERHAMQHGDFTFSLSYKLS